LQHAVHVGQYVGIPETQNAIAFRAHAGISPLISLRLVVLTAVDFNDKFGFAANKVSDIWSNGLPPHKLESGQPSIPQREP